MENLGIPKKLTQEEIEQKKKLEQNQETESPKEKDNSLGISEINTEISKKEQDIEETKNKINDIRSSLGLPPSDEIPPSIQSQKDSMEKLNQKRADIETRIKQITDRTTLKVEGVSTITNSEDIKEYKELNKKLTEINNQENSSENIEETQKFERNVKTVLEDISSQSKTMLDALYERQQNRLTPIQSNDDFQRMVSQIKYLENFDSKIDKASLQEIIDNVQRLNNSFQDFRVMQSGGQIREDSNNLDKLSFGVKKFSNTISESSSKFPIEMENKELEEGSRELKTALEIVAENSQKLWLLAVRMRENSR